MKYIELEHLLHNHYELRTYMYSLDDHPLGSVYSIVQDNIYIPDLLDWLYEDATSLETNSLFYQKIDGNIRVIDNLDAWKTDQEITYPPFIMTKENFEDMIKRWIEILSQRPLCIIIYWNDGKVRMEVKNGWGAYIKNFLYRLWLRRYSFKLIRNIRRGKFPFGKILALDKIPSVNNPYYSYQETPKREPGLNIIKSLNGPDCMYVANWSNGNGWKTSSFFPNTFSREEVLHTIHQAYDNPIRGPFVRADNTYQIIGLASNGMLIDIRVTRDGELSGFPAYKYWELR